MYVKLWKGQWLLPELASDTSKLAEPMRICFVGWADSVHVERWATYFARQGDDIIVISFSGRGHYPEGVRQYRLKLESRSMRWRILKLRYLLWKLKPDLVHVHWAHFAHPVAKAWSGPLVVTPWGCDIYAIHNQPAPVPEELLSGLKAAHAMTCDSEDLLKHVQALDGMGGKTVHLVQWGVNTEQFCPAPPDPRLLSNLGVAGRPVVLSPRSFQPVYNQETIVSAFAAVLKAVPDAVLIMKNYNGYPDYLRAIKALIHELGLSAAVHIMGEVPHEQMPDLYRMAAVTVSVPLSDATPVSLLESMACGSVPIVSDLPSLREWIRDEWNGYVVPPHDAHHLAQRIIHILKNPEIAAKCARRNSKIIEDRARHDVNMARMGAIYHDMVNGFEDKRSNYSC